MAPHEYTSPLKSIPNFRDVGATINEYHENNALKTGVLFRGARPDDASFLDRQRLVKDYAVRSIIDLRTKTEHIEQAQKRGARVQSSAAAPQSDSDAAEPLQIPGITYHNINFNGNAFSRMLISKLSWLQFFKLVFFMIIGQRKKGIRILAPSMEAMGLTGLAICSADVCTKEVKQVLDVLADETQLPAMIHCTQGKDRTGLTVMLLLFLLGVGVTAVEYDYLLSGPGLEAETEERVKEIAEIGLSRHFAEVTIGLVGEVRMHLEERYGGVEAYLEAIGVDKEMQARLRRNFLAGKE